MDTHTTLRIATISTGVLALLGSHAIAQEKPTQDPQRTKARSARVAVESDPPYGEYLVDARGKTLYLFTTDKPDESTCYGACARMWPPLITDGSPQAAAPALDPEQLGTLTRRDGSRQVTYAGWPLYYYVRDTPTNEVTGQDIHSFGGEWYLIGPDGSIVKRTKQGGEKQPAGQGARPMPDEPAPPTE